MYIEPTIGGYDSSGEQVTRRARFLILVQREGDSGGGEIRALVRSVALRQCGHWMMGRARAFGHSITISGAYGGDGLPRDVPDAVFQRATPLPADLRDAWNKGGGWNGAGSEAPAMRQWALDNIETLAPKRRNR